jgi:hypothetical protein
VGEMAVRRDVVRHAADLPRGAVGVRVAFVDRNGEPTEDYAHPIEWLVLPRSCVGASWRPFTAHMTQAMELSPDTFGLFVEYRSFRANGVEMLVRSSGPFPLRTSWSEAESRRRSKELFDGSAGTSETLVIVPWSGDQVRVPCCGEGAASWPMWVTLEVATARPRWTRGVEK